MWSISVEPIPSRIICRSAPATAQAPRRAVPRRPTRTRARTRSRRRRRRASLTIAAYSAGTEKNSVGRTRRDDSKIRSGTERPLTSPAHAPDREREREPVAKPIGMEQLGRRVAHVLLGDLAARLGRSARRSPGYRRASERRPWAARSSPSCRARTPCPRGGCPAAAAARRRGATSKASKLAYGPASPSTADHVETGPRRQHRLERVAAATPPRPAPCVAVIEVVGVVVDPVHRVDRDRHRPDPHRPEEHRGERGRVVEDHQDPLLALDPEHVQVRGDRAGQPR